MGHGDHRRGNLHVVLVVGNVLDKAAIDLDHVDGEFLQVTERGVAGAEVVHRQGQAQALEAAELVAGVVGGLQQQAFGQFQLQPPGFELLLVEDGGDGADQVRVGELLGR
jgi:hypothetical protein